LMSALPRKRGSPGHAGSRCVWPDACDSNSQTGRLESSLQRTTLPSSSLHPAAYGWLRAT
jgi:hypothetical protein